MLVIIFFKIACKHQFSGFTFITVSVRDNFFQWTDKISHAVTAKLIMYMSQ